jgi:hypothetical protein
MRKISMRVGTKYEMQRGPTRRPVPVTLISKTVPSGRSNYVRVRIEGGVGKGREREVPSISIHPLPGVEPVPKKSRRRSQAPPGPPAPDGWTPSPGEVVTWAQTLDLRLTVSEVDVDEGAATIEGKVFGIQETYKAPIRELHPLPPAVELVADEDVDQRLEDRLPEKVGRNGAPREPLNIEPVAEDEDIAERLVFAPKLLDFYRRRFASDASARSVESRLRTELRNAELIRKQHTGEYLRLRVKGRFDVVLERRPGPDDFKSCYVTRLTLPSKKRRVRKAA